MVPRRAAATAVAVAIAVAVVGAACSLKGSGFDYVRDRGTGTYFKVPDEWTVFDRGDIERSTGEPLPTAITFLSAFDGAADADVERFTTMDATTAAPAGLARVQQLDFATRDEVSIRGLRHIVVPDFDAALERGDIQIMRVEEDVRQGPGLRGQRLVYELVEDGERVVVDQSTLLDARTENLYVFLVGCSRACYEQHRRTIDEVVASWTIKETR